MSDKKHKKMLANLDKKFSETYGEVFGTETISNADIGTSVEEYSKIFAANKNLYRIAPNIVSGLKPGLTRLLWSWWLFEKRPQDIEPETLKKLRFIKVDKVTSDAQSFHPHGTSALQDGIGTLGQWWSNNVMLIIPQGSYGNLRGDRPAAGRYREACMSKFTIDCFFSDFDLYCVPMRPAYTGLEDEPIYLPAKYPYVLFNPSFSGIGWGLSSNIPPFNVTEVLEATIKLIKNPKEKIMLIPDIPTGCDIVDIGTFKEINEIGCSKILCRASSTIDYAKNIITFNSLPLDQSTSAIQQKMVELKDKKIFTELIELKDYTVEGNVKLEVYLRGDAKPDKVLQMLYNKVPGLKVTKPVDITVIDDFKAYSYGVKDLLLEWIDYRRDIVRPMILRKLQKVLSDKEMNDILMFVFNADNIDKTIQIAKTSKYRSETIERLKKEFKINTLQAAVIADMHVYNFNKDSYDRYKERAPKLKAELDEINNILNSQDGIDNIIIKQLEEGIKRYGRPRRSKVIKENDDNNKDIPNTEHLIGISETGYIKKLKLDKNGNATIGQVGKTNSKLSCLKVNNRENILVVDDNGNVTKISISAIPYMNFEDIGIELKKFFTVNGSIKSVLELPSMDILKVSGDDLGLIIITNNGIAKKIPISEFKKITDTKKTIVLNTNDKVAAAIWSTSVSKKDLLIYTNDGKGIRLPESSVPVLSLAAKGKQLVNMGISSVIRGATIVDPKKRLLFYLTAKGYGKVTELKNLQIAINKELVTIMNLSEDDSLVDIVSVNKSDKVLVYRKKSEPLMIDIDNIEVGIKQSSGKRLIKTGSDIIVGFTVFGY